MALIRGKEVKEAPHQEPANPKLYNTIKVQAMSKFQKQSPARGHWIHAKYLQMGGRFVGSKSEVDPRMRDYVTEEREKKEEAMKKKVTKPVTKPGVLKKTFP